MDAWRVIHRLAKWICIKCYKTKASVIFDWAVLPCDHLICIDCFKKHAEELKVMYKCGCGAEFYQSTYDYLVTHCPSAQDAAKDLS